MVYEAAKEGALCVQYRHLPEEVMFHSRRLSVLTVRDWPTVTCERDGSRN